jgi:hypothetical protein
MRNPTPYVAAAILCTVYASAIADITLTEGYWSTSFDSCSTGPTHAGDQCDGINIEDDYNVSGTYSGVREVEHDASGGSGRVYTVYYEGGVRNAMSTPATVRFSSPESEFWLRFYYRLPAGQHISSIFEHKILYAFTDVGVAADVCWPGAGDQIELQPRNTMGSPDLYYGSDGGWADTYGSESSSADGTWHIFEFHFDLGSVGAGDGQFEMWLDGVNHVSVTNLDWFDGGDANPTGWEYILIPHNHNVFTLAGAAPHDIDAVAVAVPSFNGFVSDSEGRPMIGSENDIAPLPPTDLRIDP